MQPIVERLEALYTTRETEIERWLGQRRAEAPPYLCNSVDLRHSGLRLAPVDTNLYPAGFNNLSAAAMARAGRFLSRYIHEHHPAAKRALIVPESHTRNLAYLDNLLALQDLLESVGLQAVIGSLQAQAPLVLTALSGGEVTQRPLIRRGDRLEAEGGFVPDLIILNNDCTSGVPPLLEGIAQPVLPPPEMGWWRRRKSAHFTAYRALAEAFAQELGLDPWLIGAFFHRCGRIDFKQQSGLEGVARAVDHIIEQAQEKHREYGIAQDPYVFVKADSGTYGMGIMTVHSGSEMLELNKKERNKMQVVKEGAQVSEVLIQEGIPTIDSVQGKPAEPMIYLIDGVPAGGIYRVNAQRDAYNNLNAVGVEFTGMCDEHEPVRDCRQPVRDCNFHAYGLVSALAALAVPREKYQLFQQVCDSERIKASARNWPLTHVEF